ncbi:MAG: hypothetical protein ACM3YF_04875 [Candidatus Zixiibacteriota bacterium]
MPKKAWLGLALASGLLLYQFFTFNLVQDDAFISFRYIRNFLDGHGLVFNIGERVEGYTNFFWIMLLAFLAKLGLPLIETARWTGVLAAVGSLGVCMYAARRFYPERGWLWISAAPFLLAANGALAYWSGSGLETVLFTLLAAASAVAYFTRPAFSLLFLALATLTRPEGGLLAFLFGIGGIVLKEKSWKETLIFWGTLILLLLPFAVFKYFYYGSLLPNPFYAKTGFSAEYIQSGLEYSWLFLKHYGGYGLLPLFPFLFWKKLSVFSRFSLLVFLGYTLYLIFIGGDVLKAHRFFVPIFFFLYLPLTDGLYQIIENLPWQNTALAVIVLLMGLYSYEYPHDNLDTTALYERGLVSKMGILGRLFAEHDYARSFATSTIGAFSYYVGNRRVIDMLGLTEREIARHPEKINGLVSSWKEKHFNARYVLSQKPEVIIFSTELKPSSPAERALYLYPAFRQNYRLEYLFGDGRLTIFYRKFRDYSAVFRLNRPAGFANLVHDGLNWARADNKKAAQMLHEAILTGGGDSPALHLMTGYLFSLAGQSESSEVYLKKGLEADSGGPLGQWYYAAFLSEQQRYTEALPHILSMMRTHPTARAFLESRGILRASPKEVTQKPKPVIP